MRLEKESANKDSSISEFEDSIDDWGQTKALLDDNWLGIWAKIVFAEMMVPITTDSNMPLLHLA